MNALILMQSINQHLVDTTINALPDGFKAYVLTGTEIYVSAPHEIVKTSEHSPVSLLSRFKSWVLFYRDVMTWIKKNKTINIDLIYAVSNPPINSILGTKIAKKYNCKFIYMEWDIYPQIIEETFQNPLTKLVCIAWHHINNQCFPQINRILTIGNHMAESINKPLKKDINLLVIPMYSDVLKMKPIPKDKNVFRIENGLLNKFVVIYSGKMGIGHNITLILDAARILEELEPEIVFLLIGFGPGYEQTKERVDNGAKNILLMKPQPDDVFPLSMASGNVGLVSEEVKLAHLFLPSKTYDMMACGMPIIGICTENDDLQDLIITNSIGSIVTDNCPKTLALTILSYYNNTDRCEKEGTAARNLATNKYSREKVTQLYRQVFLDVLKEP